SNEGIPSHALREICTLRLLDHPNIIKLHGVEIGPADTIYLYFDFLTTDLKEYLKARRSEPLSQQRFQYFSRQCLSGLTYLHCNSVIHRDLKPANLLIDCVNDVIKICDFGLARHFTFPLRPYTHEVITQWYRAPEIILGQSIYSPSVDVWSLGIIFAEMINGTPLFVGRFFSGPIES
ncbi:MAG: Cyclin-dependent kinase 3, partial [Marteilia pararefringens]